MFTPVTAELDLFPDGSNYRNHGVHIIRLLRLLGGRRPSAGFLGEFVTADGDGLGGGGQGVTDYGVVLVSDDAVPDCSFVLAQDAQLVVDEGGEGGDRRR